MPARYAGTSWNCNSTQGEIEGLIHLRPSNSPCYLLQVQNVTAFRASIFHLLPCTQGIYLCCQLSVCAGILLVFKRLPLCSAALVTPLARLYHAMDKLQCVYLRALCCKHFHFLCCSNPTQTLIYFSDCKLL